MMRLVPLPWLIGGVAAVLGVVLWRTYTLGYDVAEGKYLKVMNETLAEQEAKHQKQLRLAVREAERTATIRRRISEIRVPDSCVVSPQCLQSYNDAVRAANTGGDDGAAGTTEDSD